MANRNSFRPNPPKQQAILKQQSVVERHYQGPIPPPEELEKHEKIVSGAADRILKMAEREQAHRHKIQEADSSLQKGILVLNTKIVSNEKQIKIFGIVSALLITLTALGLGAYLISEDKKAGGIVSILGALIALVTAYLRYSSPKKSLEQETSLAEKKS